MEGTEARRDRQIRRIEMTRTGKAKVLREKLTRGDYVVDPNVVAEAILRLVGLRSSSMFVSAQPLEEFTSGTEQNEPPSRFGLA
jgi:hypothetical protein